MITTTAQNLIDSQTSFRIVSEDFSINPSATNYVKLNEAALTLQEALNEVNAENERLISERNQKLENVARELITRQRNLNYTYFVQSSSGFSFETPSSLSSVEGTILKEFSLYDATILNRVYNALKDDEHLRKYAEDYC